MRERVIADAEMRRNFRPGVPVGDLDTGPTKPSGKQTKLARPNKTTWKFRLRWKSMAPKGKTSLLELTSALLASF